MAAVLSKTDAGGRLSALFAREVAPNLAGLERRRRQHRLCYGAVVAGVLTGIFLVFLWIHDLRHALLAGAIVLAIGFFLIRVVRRSYGSQVRRAIMPVVCEAIGDVAHSRSIAPDLNLHGMAQIGLVPRHQQRRIDDVFCGRHRATGFTMAEVRLRRRSGRRGSRTVFRGLVFAIEAPRAVPGRILIARDGGWLGNGLEGWIRRFGGMRRVDLPDPAFEARFELYADRPEVARATVTPELCANLAAFAAAHHDAPLQAAFAGGRFMLAMPRRRDLFRVGSLFRRADELAGEAARLLEEVQVVHRLIDHLHGDRPQARS